jgi:two-component system, cell cycle response regulator DivK
MSRSVPQPKTVLIVEDDESAQYIFGTILQSGGYRTLTARDAHAAQALLAESLPDLIIMDVGLPGEVDGFELTRRVRSDPATRDLPILVITVYTFESDQRQAEAAGCTKFMPKPVVPSDVLTEVERLIGPADAAYSGR